MVPLYVLNDADHFKTKIFFSIFGQLTNWSISYLIGPSEKVVVREKVVPLFIRNQLVKVSSRSDIQKARKCLIMGPHSKINEKPISLQLVSNQGGFRLTKFARLFFGGYWDHIGQFGTKISLFQTSSQNDENYTELDWTILLVSPS